jgi:hypothetical protein
MIDILMPLLKQFMPFAQKKMGFKKAPRLFLKNDSENAQNPLGKTAYYDPEAKTVTIYITDRHPKDVMRSLSHELVHHCQNCRGDFSNASEMGAGYAQNDDHLRKMEREAYETGNMCFRDWEDSIKNTSYFEHLQKGEKMMSLKEWKNNELTNLLSEAWGFKFNTLQEFDEFNGTGEIQEEGAEELEEFKGGAEQHTRGRKGRPMPTQPAPESEDEEQVKEASRTDRPDRVAGRDSGGRRLDEEGDDDEIEEGGMMSTPPRRAPRGVSARGQGKNSPVQDLRSTRREPGEEDVEDDELQTPKVAKKVAERKMTKEQLRETLRAVLTSLTK